MRVEKQERPTANGAPSNDVSTGLQSVPLSTLENPKAIAAGYAVLLVRSDDRVTRQVYLSMHSATKALERAKSRGVLARMVLVELVPTTAAPVYLVGGEDR